MTRWTKGPWTVVQDSEEEGGMFGICTDRNGLITYAFDLPADSGKWQAHEEERKANAQLIAAAPELYEALHLMAEQTHEPAMRLVFGDELFDQAITALKKARGEA